MNDALIESLRRAVEAEVKARLEAAFLAPMREYDELLRYLEKHRMA